MSWLNDILGLDAKDLEPSQMAARAFVMYFVALVLIRLSGLRMLGKQTPFDYLTVLMLGAMLGRSIVAGQSFGGSILAAFVIILLHRISAWLALKNKAAGSALKGDAVPLIKDAMMLKENMDKTQITRSDIEEAMRSELNTTDLSKIKDAYLERSGKISIIEK